MKTKQLANMLIRILGLSVVVQSLPAILSGLFNVLRTSGYDQPPGAWFYPVPSLVLARLGVTLIVKSRDLAAWLFLAEEE